MRILTNEYVIFFPPFMCPGEHFHFALLEKARKNGVLIISEKDRSECLMGVMRWIPAQAVFCVTTDREVAVSVCARSTVLSSRVVGVLDKGDPSEEEMVAEAGKFMNDMNTLIVWSLEQPGSRKPSFRPYQSPLVKVLIDALS